MENLSLYLLLFAVLCGFVYGLFWLSQVTSWKRTLLKTLPVTLLTLIALYMGQPILLVLAFCCSAAGDAFLSRTGDKSFLLGLGAFLTAHLAFTVLFLSAPASQIMAHEIKIWVWLCTILLILTTLFSLWTYLGSMKIAVLIYALAIGAMNIAAWTSGQNELLLGGVTLFVISDLILAHELFVWKNARVKSVASYIVWFTYFPAQTLILYSYF